jgi:flagellar M-ring protein FliF
MNYEIGKVTRRLVMPVGDVKQLSVAVVVDGSYETEKRQDGTAGRKYLPRTVEEMTKIEALIKHAVNFDESRGDKVEVANIPFEPLTEPVLEAPEEKTILTTLIAYLKAAARPVSLGIAGMLAFLFILRPLMRWMTSTSPWDVEIFQQLPKTIAEIEREYARRGAGGSGELPYAEEVSNIISTNQDRSVQLINGWLNEATTSESR